VRLALSAGAVLFVGVTLIAFAVTFSYSLALLLPF
jgi:hypothetical protein